MKIELVEYTEDYLIPMDGNYLVKTISSGKLKTVQYLQARCKLTYNEKKKHNVTSIDVNNQVVTHISIEPLIK